MDVARVEREVAGVEPETPAGRYAVNMWKHALAMLQAPTAADGSGAVPYLPAETDTWTQELTHKHRLLDVGCLGGHGLFDLAARRQTAGLDIPQLFGIDTEWESIRIAQHMAANHAWDCEPPAFAVASVEALPFADGYFDFVIARLVIPYVDIHKALAEIARVTRPHGYVLVQLHAPAYYRHQVWHNKHNLRRVLYYLRPILASAFLQISRRQWRGRYFGETALTAKQFTAHALRHGLVVERVFGDARRPMVGCGKRFTTKAWS